MNGETYQIFGLGIFVVIVGTILVIVTILIGCEFIWKVNEMGFEGYATLARFTPGFISVVTIIIIVAFVSMKYKFDVKND